MNPPEKCYILMVEKVQKTILRSPFEKRYGYYPFMFPTRLLLGMLGCKSLLLRLRTNQECNIVAYIDGSHRTEHADQFLAWKALRVPNKSVIARRVL
jgi:hypothetical protein